MTTTILLCASKTGGGHESAARALKDAIETLLANEHAVKDTQILIRDVIEESHYLNRLWVAAYNFLLRYKPDWMKYYFALIERLKPNDNPMISRLCSRYAMKLLQELKPNLIVSLHPMVNQYLAKAIRRLPELERPPLLIVLTDPNGQFWSGWACLDADLTIVPNSLARTKLISLGISAEKIKTSGMPIEPRYLSKETSDRAKVFARLDLSPELPTICLLAGYTGGGHTLEIYKALIRSHRVDFQIIVLCGKDKRLQAEVTAWRKNSTVKTTVLPYVDSLAEFMDTCDVLITKAGGLTVFEAVARNCPLALDMLTEPMPQEAGTAAMLIEDGLARPLRTKSDINALVESLRQSCRLTAALPPEDDIGKPDAVFEIAQIILNRAHRSQLDDLESLAATH